MFTVKKMIIYKIIIYHVYQDIHNPNKQIIKIGGDYSIRYAFFMALIDSGKDFDVEITNEKIGS